jgi:cytochrome c biogenesis protein CcdA
VVAKFLADVTVAVHMVALLLIGFGGFIAWRWPKLIFIHMFAVAWGVLVNVAPVPCPFTALENYFRHQQGLGDLPGGFNAYYLYGTVFPQSWLPAIGVIAIAVVGYSYVGVYHRWRHRDHTEDARTHRVRLG